jgi:hypothetical protein
MTLIEAKQCINIAGIYLFRNKINGKCYVGQAIKIRKRFLQHMSKFRENHPYPLYAALNKYGLENFEFEILETFENLNIDDLNKILNEREIYWIAYYKSYENGYNQTLGGEATLGWVPSDETRRKLSESLKGKVTNPDSMKHCKFINIKTLEWIEFESQSDATKYFNVSRTCIVNRINLKYKSPLNGLYLSEEQYNYYKENEVDISILKSTSGKFEFKYSKEEFVERLNSLSNTKFTRKDIPELFGICDATFYNYLHEWNIPSPMQTHRKYKYLIVEDTINNKYYKYTFSEFAKTFNLNSPETARKTVTRYEDGSLYKKCYKIYSIFEQPYGYIYPDQDGEVHHFKNNQTGNTITSIRSSLLSLFDIIDDVSNWIKID